MPVKKLSIMHYYIAKKKSKNWMSFLYITCNTELFFFRKLIQSKNGHSHPARYLLTATAVLEEKNPEDLFDASWTGAIHLLFLTISQWFTEKFKYFHFKFLDVQH